METLKSSSIAQKILQCNDIEEATFLSLLWENIINVTDIELMRLDYNLE